MFNFLLLVLAFAFLLSRIQKLERKVYSQTGDKPLKKPESVTPHEVRTDMPRTSPVLSTATEAHVSTYVSTPVSKTPEKKGDGTEFAVGTKVFTGLGIVAVFLGVAFFLRYAFENNLISEPMRVMLGVLLGVVIATTGHVLRKKYPSYGLSLVGGGLGVVYLSIYAAYAFYALINVPTAFIVLIIVTLVGVLLSLFYNSLQLVSFSFLGAFIIPLLLPLSLSVHVIGLYLIALNIGILLTGRYKAWPELTAGTLIGTSLVFMKWIFAGNAHAYSTPTQMYILAIFLIYIVTTILNYIQRERNYKGIDGFLLYAVPTIYFVLNLPFIDTKEGAALLLFAIGGFYVLAGIVVRVAFGTVGDIKKLSNIMLVIASVAIPIATALYFNDTSVTLLWAFEAIVMVLIGAMLDSRPNRVMGVIMTILTGLRALAFDTNLPQDASFIFNERSLILLCALLPFIAVWGFYSMYAREKNLDLKEEGRDGRWVGALGIFIIPLVWVTLEAYQGIETRTELYLPLIWSAYVLLAVSLSFLVSEKIFRFLSYIVMIGTMLFLVSTEWSLPRDYYHLILNIRFYSVVGIIVVLGFVSWLMKVYESQMAKDGWKVRNFFMLCIYVLLLWAVSLEVLDYYNAKIRTGDSGRSREIIRTLENTKRVVLSAVWLLYALGGLAIGILHRSSVARHLSIALFFITIFKIFIYDTANLSDVFRFISFITLGVILLLAGYSYYRFKDRILQFVKVEGETKSIS